MIHSFNIFIIQEEGNSEGYFVSFRKRKFYNYCFKALKCFISIEIFQSHNILEHTCNAIHDKWSLHNLNRFKLKGDKVN